MRTHYRGMFYGVHQFWSSSEMNIEEVAPLGLMARIHSRPEYTKEDARIVCYWLNGHDPCLVTMKDRAHDEWDPVNRAKMGHPDRRGLVPLSDSE